MLTVGFAVDPGHRFSAPIEARARHGLDGPQSFTEAPGALGVDER